MQLEPQILKEFPSPYPCLILPLQLLSPSTHTSEPKSEEAPNNLSKSVPSRGQSSRRLQPPGDTWVFLDVLIRIRCLRCDRYIAGASVVSGQCYLGRASLAGMAEASSQDQVLWQLYLEGYSWVSGQDYSWLPINGEYNSGADALAIALMYPAYSSEPFNLYWNI